MLTSIRSVVSIGATLALAACAAPASAPEATAAPDAAPAGAASITPDAMRARIATLSADSMAGRDTPSPGLEAGAAYIAAEFERMGLAPAGDSGTFIQRYPLPLLALDTATVHFGTVADGENRMLRYGTDFFAIPAPAPESAEMLHGSLVYLGEFDPAAFSAAGLAGNVPVVTLSGDPSGRAWWLAMTDAQRAARQAGASALVVALGSSFPTAQIPLIARRFAQPQRGLPGAESIPVFFVAQDAAAAVLDRGGVELAGSGHSSSEPVVVPGVEAHFSASLATLEDTRVPNVVGVLPGSDPALSDEYVVLSAHMDHVGIGQPVNGDSIYNGADDNASGTSALIEVAGAMASLPTAPRRSILFLLVSGEEKGLLGSRWFSDHPTVPLDGIVANINVDMIGHNSPDSIVVIGKDYSSLGEVVNAAGAAHPELGLVVSDDIWPEERFFFRSDHFNFARKEIPAIFFFAGVHECYHRPCDEVAAIDADKAARVARLIFHTATAIADADARPTWHPEGLEEVRALTR